MPLGDFVIDAGETRRMDGSSKRFNLLTFTTLYPNAIQPSHGIFVETRLAHLVASGRVATKVVAPIPLSADLAIVPAAYRQLGTVPHEEERRGVTIFHPRYPVVPKIGMTIAPLLLYLSARRRVAALMRDGHAIDLIDAHYFYPDGIAAAMLAREFGRPFVVTARGTDINLIPQYRLPRAMIRWAAGRSAGIVTVCAALKDELVELGVSPGKIRVLRNGVDLALFHPQEKAAAAPNRERPVLLSVGHLIERKGHDLVIRALPLLPAARLVIAGDGPLGDALRRLAIELGVADRVQFVGAVPQRDLAGHYRAADILVLASSREGWANVLLEAMACGTPVVASNVWGTPEVVASPEAGELLDARTPDAIARAVGHLLARMPAPAAVRAYAERFSWDDTTRGQLDLFADVLRGAADLDAPRA
ncbi:MAG TPA: glycosyltransferase family 4 protein [Stellaceae bacterium]|nr:glycosyltransferase family 4 protein [Stellaceae bacterium]